MGGGQNAFDPDRQKWYYVNNTVETDSEALWRRK